MEIKERQVDFPDRRKITKISEEENGDLIVDIVKAEGNVSVAGTELNVGTLQKINWRDDESVSFAVLQGNDLPSAEIDKTKIVTLANGETWLLPPGNLRAPGQIGKTTGTTVEVNGIEKDSVRFVGDPQEQIDGLKTRTSILESKANEFGSAENFKTSVLNAAYPVGTIYMSVANVSPASIFGGTWAAWGQGRVPVGTGNNGETNYSVAEQTGGSENSIAIHDHIQDGHTHETHTGQLSIQNSPQLFATGAFSTNTVNGTTRNTLDAASLSNSRNLDLNAVHNEVAPIVQNKGIAGGNRMPYITCFMWKRMA